jgi:hypothetical protein
MKTNCTKSCLYTADKTKSHRNETMAFKVGFGSTREIFIQDTYFTSSINKESSSIKPSISSPTTNSPTPAGVPVKTRSPIFTEK